MTTPDDLEKRHTLLTATARHDALRARDALAPHGGEDDGDDGDGPPDHRPLSREEALELLALGEVIVRKAACGRQLSVRSARRAGASWSRIGAALGTSKQAAWEAHNRWIDEQAERHPDSGHRGLDDGEVAAARALAGRPDEDSDDSGGSDDSGDGGR
ncbi:hypothetical protein CUT44_29730 [Streptomyces carminius]|uniref:Uncharacterized protein n=1 Tax=Streptomyces carminius TaxID=2665496 RepID=A0A2M8LR29_9ACTN|nr:hypothetical protein [Streptomyces carminius]PJE94414.1 hypothetical protein CUT44_29730 [Streptomyces carminius]